MGVALVQLDRLVADFCDSGPEPTNFYGTLNILFAKDYTFGITEEYGMLGFFWGFS